jgi:hypothetical protein
MKPIKTGYVIEASIALYVLILFFAVVPELME